MASSKQDKSDDFVEPVGPIAHAENTPPQPPDFPTEETREFMMRHYGRLLTWPEYHARSIRFVSEPSDFVSNQRSEGPNQTARTTRWVARLARVR
jgi:hypothetical protein